MTANSHIITFSFHGIEAYPIEVQCAISPGLPSFSIVGLPDKAITEARERIRATFGTMAIAFPSKRIIVNLSPADMIKGGAHFDLPIALSILSAIDVLPRDATNGIVALGELSLDGNLKSIPGILPAALKAAEMHYPLFCPNASAREAAWIDAATVYGANSLRDITYHLTGQKPLPIATAVEFISQPQYTPLDLCEIKGQERAKRAMEIAAAGRHHLFMVGAPGSGKSMLAARMPGLLPPLTAEEALENSIIKSIAGGHENGNISATPPFRDPHHTASIAAIVGGGKLAKPGEISLAHNGVLFMDEFPEFARMVLETLRQPIETGYVTIARANAHIRYPCRFLLIAAANPCRCGYMYEPEKACVRAPICGADYLNRISGPLLDRFDLRLEIPSVSFATFTNHATSERSQHVRARIQTALDAQNERYADLPTIRRNADINGDILAKFATPDNAGHNILQNVAEKMALSARGYNRIRKVARTIADLDGSDAIKSHHIAEAVNFRLIALEKNPQQWGDQRRKII